MSPAGAGLAPGSIHRANSPYQTTTPAFHTFVCRYQPALVIGTRIVSLGFECASELHQSPVPSFQRKPESRGVGMGNVVRGLVPRWGGGGAWESADSPYQATIPALHTLVCRYQPALDWYENSGLLPRNSTNPGTVIPEGRNPEGWGEGNVVRGLVPRWGGGGAWQNRRYQFAVPSHDSGSSYPRVPVPAGISDWYENSVTWLRMCLGTPPIPGTVIPVKAGIQRGGDGQCSAGACPPLGNPEEGRGRIGAYQLAVPSHNSGSSYLRVPVPAGISDWYENSVTWLRMCLGTPPIPGTVIPVKAGIQRGGDGQCSAGACPPLGSGRGECSAGACPPLGPEEGRGRIGGTNSPYQATTPAFHTFVCRHQPALAIGTRIVSLGFECASELHQSPVPSFQRKLESRGVGMGNVVRGACPPLGSGRGECSAGACPPLGPEEGRGTIRRANSPYQATTPALHTFVCRHQPALVIGTRIVSPGFECASELHQSPVPSFRRRPESRGGGERGM